MEDDKYLDLAIKRIYSPLSASENADLEAWIAADPANQQAVTELQAAWEAAGALTPDPDIDLDTEFAELESKLNQEALLPEESPILPLSTAPESRTHTQAGPGAGYSRNTRTRRLSRSQGIPRRGIAIAAAIVLLAVIGILVIPRLSGDAEPQWITASTQNETKTITLPDGSTVTLEQNSSLKYPKEAQSDNRTVELTGQAFFAVQKDPSKPFQVKTEAITVTVLGTSFMVHAFPDSSEAWVEVKTGKVRMEANTVQGKPKTEQILTPGERGTFARKTFVIRKSGASKKFSKKYRGTPVYSVLDDLKQAFRSDIQVTGSNLDSCRVSVEFEQSNLKDVLDILKTLFSFEIIELGKNRYQLSGGGCQ